jgi:predicted RNA-binding Zn-ribbon protein involved in translation (DUF1610 family)
MTDLVTCPHCGEVSDIGGLVGPDTNDCPRCGKAVLTPKIIYNRTRVTYHHGNAFEAAGIDVEPFAVFTYDGTVDRALIDKIGALIREHVNTEHGDFCNIKLSTEDWDV